MVVRYGMGEGEDGTKGVVVRCMYYRILELGGRAGGARIVVWTHWYDGDTRSSVVKVLIEDRLGGEDDGGEGRGLRITCGECMICGRLGYLDILYFAYCYVFDQCVRRRTWTHAMLAMQKSTR